jgi:phage-related protein
MGGVKSTLAIYAKSGIMTNMERHKLKQLVWIGSSLHDLKQFPEEVKDAFGYALYLAQTGGKHPAAKPLKGFSGAGVLEIVEDHDTNTYRAVYTVRMADTVMSCMPFRKSPRAA